MKKKYDWKWITGSVNDSDEHIEIRFGNIEHSEWDQWKPIACVSAPKDRTFAVKFLIAAEMPSDIEMINAVKEELDFYLIDKGGDNPWAYALYHCGTAANAYSMVHWSFFPKGWKKSVNKNK